MSYLVVYQNSSYLNEIQTTYIILLLTGTMGLILLTLFIYQIKNEQKILEEMVNEKTKEFKELNESLENIVEKRTNEQAILLSLFDKGDNVLFKWKNNEKWSIEHVSKNVENLFGYNSKEFLSGKVEYTEVIHKDDLVNVIKEVSNIIDTQGDFYIHKPYRIITKDGHIKWIKNYRITVKNKKDKITNFVGYITDITAEINHQKELEKEVKEKTKSLKELNDNLEEQIQIEILKNTEKEKLIFQQLKMASMGEMLANIAHQWRQPLNSISISASGLQLQKELGQLNDEIFQYGIDGIIESTDFLSQTIDDFQNFLKPNDEISKFDIKNSIEKSLQLVVATFKKSSICTVLNVSDILVSGKQGEFTQVILNIINNAKDILIEKNEINNRFILIDTNFIENEVIISIKDNAGGIPKDIINNIFDQYFTTKDTDGTGIGLHMSKEIIESHMNGKLEVKNDTFKINDTLCSGANFIITLPTEEK